MTQLIEQQEIDEETQLKWKFAEFLLRYPTDPFKAALRVAYGDTTLALTMLQHWQFTSEIAHMKEALIEELGEEAFLPSKTEMIRDVLTRAENTLDDSDYCKLMNLVFDARGMTSKSQPSVVVNNSQVNNRIMQIPVMINQQGHVLSDEEWEQSLIQQQKTLTDSGLNNERLEKTA